MVHDVEERFGPIDILVNNAGMAAARGLDDITEEDFDRAIAVNLKSVFLCTQAVMPGMRARRWGRIVNISSIGARIGAGSVSVAYGAAKAGVEGLTRAYALRLASEGVTVNAVAPGLVETEMGQPLLEPASPPAFPWDAPEHRDEIAQAVLLLVSNGYMTGQTIAVNGGSLFHEGCIVPMNLIVTAAAAATFAIHDFTPDFWRFWEAAQDQPVERQAQLWQQLYVSKHQAVFDDLAQPCKGQWNADWFRANYLPDLPQAVPAIRDNRRRVCGQQLDAANRRFLQTFPDMQW